MIAVFGVTAIISNPIGHSHWLASKRGSVLQLQVSSVEPRGHSTLAVPEQRPTACIRCRRTSGSSATCSAHWIMFSIVVCDARCTCCSGERRAYGSAC